MKIHLYGSFLLVLFLGCTPVAVDVEESNSSNTADVSSSEVTSSDESSSEAESSTVSSEESSEEMSSSESSSEVQESSSESSSATEVSSSESSSEAESAPSGLPQADEIVNSPTNLPELICEWGTEKLNICGYDTQDEMVNAFIDAMTTDDKVAQMTQTRWFDMSPTEVADWGLGSIIHTQGGDAGANAIDWVNKMRSFQEAALNSKFGIPLLIGVDAVHGQNTFDGAVLFPHNSGMGATRNMDLIEQAARVTAREIAGTGFNWTFSPCIAMPQHENWGRVYEGFTEDTDLTTQSVIASIKGHHQDDLAQPYTVATTAKHFIGDGATDDGIEGGNATMTDDALRNIYLPPYAAAVDQGVASIMVGFNSINGTNMHQNEPIVMGILKGELGFDGVIVTDWEGGTRYGHARTVVNAGVDIAMQPGGLHGRFIDEVKEGIADESITMDRINDAVRRILHMKFNLGLFRDPFPQDQYAETVGSNEHRAVARQAVRESMILFKNDNDALPIADDETVAIIGEHANSTGLQSGGWSINWQGTHENYKGGTNIKDAILRVSPNAEFAEHGCTDGMDVDKAVVVVGETPYAEFMGDAHSTDYNLWMTGSHQNYIESCTSRGITTIVILLTGRALAVETEFNKSDAFVAAWFIGSEGDGVADFLFGLDGFKPNGKTAYSWPVDIADIPLAKDDSKALFKFGDGMQEY